ncbi:MAG TPA: polysaccharide biosynthesis/export family protein [Pseudolabrys sp.]|nr:polysaccharide biosynthesis/export family protein [Pseudolabrys sp.]
MLAFTAAGCARHQPAYYVMDPATGQRVPVVQQYGSSGNGQYGQYQAESPQSQYPQGYEAQSQAYAQPQQDDGGGRGLFNSHHSEPSYSYQPQYAYQQQSYAQPPQAYQQQQSSGQQSYAAQDDGQSGPAAAPRASTVMQYQPPQQAAASSGSGYGYAYAPAERPYTLDSGDKLRIVVFGQAGISGDYLVDAGGQVTLPLVGSVPARGHSTKALSQMIAERLKQGYVRDPHVTVSIASYRPFFILGEVTNPGQYPFVPNMTAESAVAIAGGFSPRAKKGTVQLTRNMGGQQIHEQVPLGYPLQPGDTVVVKERWF